MTLLIITLALAAWKTAELVYGIVTSAYWTFRCGYFIPPWPYNRD